jgi:hypothetical protein
MAAARAGEGGAMSEREECRHGSAVPLHALEELPESQGGIGRHRCVACAFKAGARWQSARVLDALVERGQVDLARELMVLFHV